MPTASKGAYYVTTPIYYVNGDPHIGSAYTTVLADALNRFYRFLGYETFFLTGTDEHGDKIQQAAQEAGLEPIQYTDRVSNVFKQTWAEMGLEYSRFIRTTEDQHKRLVTDILQRIYDQGDIYFGEYGGNYCVGCERFLTDKELVDGLCPDHRVAPKYVAEKNYFFRMSKYQDQLIRHITEVAPDFIRPERYKNEVLAMLREPLEDLCISRPKSRLTWGIELSFDKNYVTYVWFDALINYLTGVDCPDGERYKKFWPVCEHLVGKDIIKPHGIFWPTMLLAAGYPLYKHLNVHGFWVTPTGKMSKSLGNVIDPIAVKNDYGMDTFRYYVFREMVFGLDGVFSHETLETRYNADLANNLGNLVSRTLAMVHQYRGGSVPQGTSGGELEAELRTNATNCVAEVEQLVRNMEIQRALERIWNLIDAANVYIDRTKPWALAKAEKASEEARDALDTSLYHQVEVVRVTALLISAFMPKTSESILTFLGVPADRLRDEQSVQRATWGGTKPNSAVQRGEALFPRREKKGGSVSEEKVEKTSSGAEKAATGQSQDAFITIDHFSKVELCVGQIVQAERVPKSEKLLRLEVDLGETSGPRQILSGIGKHYEPETLIGRKVAVVKNLKPAKLMGLESRGMILAASDENGHLELVSVGAALPPGAQIT